MNDQFISSKYVFVSRLKGKIYRWGYCCDGQAFHPSGGGVGGSILLAPVVQRLDNAIQWINRYPVDKC